MLEKLKELLRGINAAPEITCPRFNKEGCKGCEFDKGCVCDVEGREAAYLLANGVLCPPCKVGDTVYCVGKKEIIECVVREFSLTSKGLDSLIISQKYISPNCTFIHSKNLENLHKIKFTKEEAEEALKGGAE